MSLTGHLGRAQSPVRAFFASRLANTSAVVADASSQLRAGRTGAPLAAAADVNAGRAGTAVDYLLRFALAPDPCPPGSAGRLGAGMLGKDLSVPALLAVDDALNHVRELAPYRRDVSDDDWLALTQISLLLATFEIVCRSRRPPAVLEDLHEIPSDWRGWAALACNDTEVEDVAILGWAAAQDHHELRGSPLVCNPTFAQATALRGADADLLTDDGVLLDFKSTSTARVCERKDLWQLCGYALADTHDELEITAVGLSALRWRTRVVWPLDELLDRLAGAPVTIGALRAQFAGLLDALAGRRGRAR